MSSLTPPTAQELAEIEKRTRQIEKEKKRKQEEREEKLEEKLKKRRRYFLEKFIAPIVFILTVLISLVIQFFYR